MLVHFLISLAAVFGFAIFEYAHDKAAYNIKTAWVKYAAALILGTFGFSYLLQWKYFQYVEQGALVVSFLFFFWTIIKALKIKGVPGQSAKVISFVVLLPFFSCRTDDSKILAIRYDSVGFHTVQDHSQIGEIRQPGDTIWAHTAPIKDTIYHVMANTAEQWHYAWVHGDVWWLIGAILLLLVGFLVFKKYNDSGSAGQSSVVGLAVVMAIAAGIAGTSLGWWDGYSADIDKLTYDQQIHQYGNLNQWFHNRLR
jgi:hypothetical protein